jgi:hypothetical protein
MISSIDVNAPVGTAGCGIATRKGRDPKVRGRLRSPQRDLECVDYSSRDIIRVDLASAIVHVS